MKPTDVVYPSVWTQPGAAAEGLWMPSFWVRVTFGITDLDAKNLVQLLQVRPSSCRNHGRCQPHDLLVMIN